MKLEHKLYLAGSQDGLRLTEDENRELQANPELQAVLSENQALKRLAAGGAEPPSREALLAHVYTQTETTQEPEMKLIHRLFRGKPAAMRLALAAALVLALVALSLLLPRAVLTPGGMAVHGGAQAAYAATEGYMLVFDFGDVEWAAVQPVIHQLYATVAAFKDAHNITWESDARMLGLGVDEGRKEARTTKHAAGADADAAIGGGSGSPPQQGGLSHGRTILAIPLCDASLLDELKAELKKIPGLPEPKVIDATWFSEQGLPLPGDDGIKLEMGMGGDALHSFNFPKDATKEEIEQAINDWLVKNHPDKEFKVSVVKEQDGEKTRLEIRIQSSEGGGAAGGPAKVEVEGGDQIKLTLKIGADTHTFTFAEDATEEQIAGEINAWLAQNEPGKNCGVTVTKHVVDGKTRLQVQIKTAQTEDKDTEQPGGAQQG